MSLDTSTKEFASQAATDRLNIDFARVLKQAVCLEESISALVHFFGLGAKL